MSRSYTAMSTLITQKLQSAGTADYSVSEVDNQLEDSLKEFATYQAHLIPIIFKVESRYGMASTTSANNLVDTAKGQFLATDDNNEKVVHNTNDNTWAVVSSFSSTAQVGLTGDIFIKDEQYRIYNKYCWNKRQIYVGDVPENYKIDSIEYPIGQKRNWALQENSVVELDVDFVEDSNAGTTLTILPDVDILVRFSKPHILSQLTDYAGTFAATAAAAATSLSATALKGAGTIEVGEEFTVQYHKAVYIVAASATITANTAAISFYPPLEAAVGSTATVLTFRQTSLNPAHEELFADLVAARLIINKAPKFMNAVNVGGGAVWSNYMAWGNARLTETLSKLRRLSPPKFKRRWPTD